MGYDLHIIRTEDWTAADCPGEFTQTTFMLPGGPGLHWSSGEVVVSGADESHLDDLKLLAAALRARVQGDDGEFYD